MTTTPNTSGSATGIDLAALEQLARDVESWSSVNHVWRDEGDEAYVIGHITEDGEKHPVVVVDTEQYEHDGPALANFYAAANPQTVLALIALARATPQHPDCQSKPGEWSACQMRTIEAYTAMQPPRPATPQHSVTEQASVDWLGLALDLESQAKRVESQTAERAMSAAAHGLRLMGAQPLASTAATQPEQASIKTWQERQDEDNEQWNASVYMRQEIADLRAALAIPASTAAREQPVWMSEHELKQMRRILAVAGVCGVESLDAETAMPCFWSLIGQIANMLQPAASEQQASVSKLPPLPKARDTLHLLPGATIASRERYDADQMRDYAIAALSGRATIPSEADERTGELIYAADERASAYDGDDREGIKNDVINAFYGGAEWERRRNALTHRATTATYTVDGVVMSPLEYIDHLHTKLGATTAADQQGDTVSASIDSDPEFHWLAEYWRGEPYGTRSFLNAWAELVAHIDGRAQQGAAQAQAGEDADWKGFALSILIDARDNLGSDVDGGMVQDCATECGLLVKVTAQEPCGENCACAELGDFPQDCYRYSKATLKAIREDTQRAAMAAPATSNQHQGVPIEPASPTLFGLPIVIDDSVAPGQAEFRSGRRTVAVDIQVDDDQVPGGGA